MFPPFRVFSRKNKQMYPIEDIGGFDQTLVWIKSKVTGLNDLLFIHIDGNDQDGDIMESIGRKDKNGKLIFEGDIVDCSRYDGEEIFEVIIWDVRFIPQEMYGSSLDSIEVVGNIFQNPEKVLKNVYEFNMPRFHTRFEPKEDGS